MNILILGVTGMLGNAVFKQFFGKAHFNAWGTLRSPNGKRCFPRSMHKGLHSNVDVLNHDSLVSIVEQARPEVVINCVGLIKQLADANDPLAVLPINAMLPHRLANVCALVGARLIHISTDCVFRGDKGLYSEADQSDALDLYGKSKYIGELHDVKHAVTLRTSIIGHELDSHNALIDWFLSQNEGASIKGYEKAIFSGLPTVELARVIRDIVIPAKEMHGLYHVSADPIDKLSLLRIVADVYKKQIEIIPDKDVCIDRSLDSSRFRSETQYIPPKWPELIELMYRYQ